MLVDSWLTSSVEYRESFSSRDDMGCTEHSSSCSTEIDDPLYLRRLSQGSLEVPKRSQATFSVWCGSRGGDGANARDFGLISIWFLVHRAILHSLGDISVLLVLWQCCWGLSGVQSSKSRLLMCLIGKTLLLWTQCRGIGPHLAERGESHEFSRVAQEPGVYSRVMAGMSIRNWSLFSEVRTPDYVWGSTQECNLGVAGQYGRFWKLSGSSGLFFYLTQSYCAS